MAYIRKLKTGWRAEVERKGVRVSQVLPTKAQAQAWAVAEEAAILASSRGQYPAKTLGDAFRRYEIEVSRKKRGARAEALRFAAWQRDHPELCAKVISKVTAADIAAWRDARLQRVSPASVLREAAQLRNVFSVARDEWLWCGESPFGKVKMPRDPLPRTRRATWREIRRLMRTLGYVTGRPPQNLMQEVAWAYLVAQHTAMRAGEVRGLARSSVNLATRVVTLKSHKTLEREGTRFVPFTRKAARVLAVLDAAAAKAGRDAYFTISPDSLDVLFRKARDRQLIDGLRFHDSRADALTRLSRKVDVMTLAKISGHRDLSLLMNAYYRERPEDIAARLG